MSHERLARTAVAGDDVHHAGRQADLFAQLGQAERGEGRELGGLEHDRVSHRQRGRDFPGEHQQREVPRDDLPDHPHRLAVGQLLFHELSPAGVVIEVPRHEGYVDVP